ncbi:MAG: tetratricopeptide repeat protein, partial [Chloroflexota bacterium]
MVSHYPEKPKNKRKPQRYKWAVPILVLVMGVALALFSASSQEPYEYEASATELYHTAMRLQAQGQYEASIDVFTQSIAMDEGFTDMFYVDRGVSYAYLGEDDLAQADYLHTLNYINEMFDEVASDPHFTIADYYNNRGYTYIMLGDYEKAIADLDRAIA